ncbi:MAG: 3-dehydroquinate synthase [Vampirovibrionales bacterium]|nr:3-dehydroquinate synthase [Vampirovibrionales bacterium]
MTVSLPARARDYQIIIEPGLLSTLGPALAPVLPAGSRALLISDETVYGLYGESALAQLDGAGYQAQRFVIPDGETSKTLSMVESAYDAALKFGLSRRDAIIALGGGVVGDLAGFCAATYYRGTTFVQIPTTLLAQIDSSVGGKTAVNFRTVKNGVGAFYQPARVLIDPAALSTLDARQARAGLAEAAKYALLEISATGDSGLFGFLSVQAEALRHLSSASPATRCELIARCCQIKAEVVAADETERSGARAMLNLGHTFGHALEAAAGYGTLLHGEAVAMGMAMALEMSTQLDLLGAEEARRARALLRALDLPLTPPAGLRAETLLALMTQDKKAHDGRISFVLPVECAGRVRLCDDVPQATALAVVRAALAAR